MFKRYLLPKLLAALKDTAVVLVNGARQSGKSTLVQSLPHARSYVTLDNLSALHAARLDPEGFIQGTGQPVILDEIQRVPELFVAIKAQVDRYRKPGSYLLTGSANVFLLPTLSDSLAGRMEILTLWPLSMQEIMDNPNNFIDALFAEKFYLNELPALQEKFLFKHICQGGYPEALQRNDTRRSAWFESYLATILQRDVKEISNIESLHELLRLLKLLAARNMTLLNYAELSRSVGIPQTTIKRYMTLLEATFIISFLPPWHRNLGKRLVKSSKILLNDTGLSADLLGATTEKLRIDRMAFGHLLESFIVLECQKQRTWCKTPATLYHFRTQAGEEVDLVLESKSGILVGIEIKAAQTVSEKDFRGLKILAELAGKSFKRGIVFYTGKEVVPFGKNLFAVPVNALWEVGL